MVSKLLSVGILCFAIHSLAVGIPSQPIRLDVYQEEVSSDTATALWAIKNPHSTTLPEQRSKDFWFYNFTFGDSSVKSIIDTGSSSPIILKEKWYHPSPHSVHRNGTFHIGFGTTHSDGTGILEIRGSFYSDTVGVPNLSLPHQGFAVADVEKPKKQLPADPHAIFGFAGGNDFFSGHVRNWFRSVCKDNLVSECRFGLAFGTNKRGKQILGALDSSLYKGELVEVPLPSGATWVIEAEIVVNGKSFLSKRPHLTDSGTSIILGPRLEVQQVYKELGITPIITKASIRGYYPCDKKLSFGFRIGGQLFNVNRQAMAFQNLGNGSCIAAIGAVTDINNKNNWIIGQAFFHGLYVDHNLRARTMGFAHLKSVAQ